MPVILPTVDDIRRISPRLYEPQTEALEEQGLRAHITYSTDNEASCVLPTMTWDRASLTKLRILLDKVIDRMEALEGQLPHRQLLRGTACLGSHLYPLPVGTTTITQEEMLNFCENPIKSMSDLQSGDSVLLVHLGGWLALTVRDDYAESNTNIYTLYEYGGRVVVDRCYPKVLTLGTHAVSCNSPEREDCADRR